ncbi:hypothetical protein GW943_01865 [Candidatus Parcubacteria bacterium]|uniref:Septum formation initiator n=1 Tax=Candidatus Kaiserbacteria bacterium CG10_big_fil_rev_8_21_14_0_10_47_16 TaxID=1974608 RepID=A0A2H0UEC6_9BACT|nr:hypothetical protein [Candidatus Parcubacteria bacterium]PIR84778.1 MAG: hypothetical protein COU16_01155 [Candidatus Kaiserbacteria bacterium CG10_big_fil_rev_8_21_14_0_10_47_16]
MFDFYEKRKIRGLLYSKVTIAILVILIFLLGKSVFERFTVAQEIDQKREEKTAELASLSERAATLEGKVEYLKKDRGKEEELRNRFDAAKEGEQVVIIVDNAEKKNVDASQSNNSDTLTAPHWYNVFLFWR